MIINRYALKPDITSSDLHNINARNGGAWIKPDADMFIGKTFFIKTIKHIQAEISINIAFSSDIHNWNDFDNILVLDEDLGQPYSPFYDYMDGKIKLFPFLQEVIERYNDYMNMLGIFEIINQFDNG